MRWLTAVLVTLLVSAAPALAQAGPEAPIRDEIKGRVEQLRSAGSLELDGGRVRRDDVLMGAYEHRGFAPLWADGRALRDLARALREVRTDGLDPRHYHLAALEAAPSASPSQARAAELDLLATDALVRVARDLRFGRVDPAGPTTGRDPPWPFGGPDPVAGLLRVAASGRVAEEVLALRPAHFVYRGLVDALADLRRVQEAGGWEPVPTGPVLRRDSADARVPALRRRLVVSGDLPPALARDGLVFDAALEDAVRSFQHRHGLNEDGLVGPATLAELNVPVEQRVDQVRINLERARWVTHDLPDTFVAVNVAGARVYFVRDREVAFESRVIVGREYTRTPVFSAPMRYVDLNPTWTVPPGIVGEVLANVRKDPGYLRRQGMRILDHAGRPVDPSRIDFSRYTARSFPYVFRQDAGPANPLGRIKLMFPNPYNVYLHDTPSRGLFEQERRLFSHGCIRVQDPVGLAELVLGDARWSREALEAAIATGKTRTIPLEKPLPVLILYWTASADLHGELHFYADVYGRDQELLAALDRALP